MSKNKQNEMLNIQSASTENLLTENDDHSPI